MTIRILPPPFDPPPFDFPDREKHVFKDKAGFDMTFYDPIGRNDVNGDFLRKLDEESKKKEWTPAELELVDTLANVAIDSIERAREFARGDFLQDLFKK